MQGPTSVEATAVADRFAFELNSSDWMMVLITGILVFITLVMAITAIWQARIAQKQSLTSLLLSFLDLYSSKDVLVSLAELRKYKSQNSEQIKKLSCLYICTYKNLTIQSDVRDEARIYVEEHEHEVGCSGISEHRSRVSWFYSKIWRLDKYGFLSRNTMKTLCSLDGAGAFLEVAVPLTLAIRYVKIHNCDERTFRIDPNVQWFRDIERIYDRERPDLRQRY